MKFTTIFLLVLVAVSRAFPQSGVDTGKETETRLDRPSTEATPELSECSLNALLESAFGSSGGSSNCNEQPKPSNSPSYVPETYPQQPQQPEQPPNYVPETYPQQPEQPPNYVPETYPQQPEQPPFTPANPDGPAGHGDSCTCVQYYLCNDNNTINDNGIGLIDIRIKEDECDSYLEKCCGGTILDKPNIPPPTPTPQTPQEGSYCGVRNPEGIGFRITGDSDNEAQYGEFPWMVAVVRPDPTLNNHGKTVSVYQCGGSLIHPRVVLTGAHCVQGKDNLVIRAGEWDTQTKNELYPTQDRKVSHVITHEQFHPGTLANDPALLILESPVDMSVPSIGLICLPEPNENMDRRNCLASGWGKDQFGREGKYQVILKRVEVPIVERRTCVDALRETRLGQRFKLHESFICAGGVPGKDTCKGDGGSPLVCPSRNNPNVYVQAGIVAWGIDCNTKTPGVYASVPYFVNWIHNKLEQYGISP